MFCQHLQIEKENLVAFTQKGGEGRGKSLTKRHLTFTGGQCIMCDIWKKAATKTVRQPENAESQRLVRAGGKAP